MRSSAFRWKEFTFSTQECKICNGLALFNLEDYTGAALSLMNIKPTLHLLLLYSLKQVASFETQSQGTPTTSMTSAERLPCESHNIRALGHTRMAYDECGLWLTARAETEGRRMWMEVEPSYSPITGCPWSHGRCLCGHPSSP